MPATPNMSLSGGPQDTNRVLLSAVTAILRKLVRLLLRQGVSFQVFSELAKRAYVQVALDEFGIPDRKPSTSRAALLTGLSRKEIHRLMASAPDADGEYAERYNRAARVISGWVRDGEFLDSESQPLLLRLEGSGGSFADLVRRYSADVPPRAVLDELLRVGAVERLDDGGISLVTRAYVPRTSGSDKLAILGTDVSDLIETIDHNVQHPDGARFQRKVMYDNLSVESVASFRELSAARSQGLMEYLDSWLSQHDRDVNPAAGGTGRMRAGLAIYFFEENCNSSKDAI